MKRPLRVLLGTHHIASVLWEYRQGLRSLGIDARVVVWEKHPWGYPSDIEFCFKGNKYIKVIKRLPHLPKLIHKFDVFHFIFANSLLPYPYNLDVYILKLMGKKIVMQFVGSDIRPIDVHEKNDPMDIINKRIKKKKKRAEFWEKYADSIISYPEQSQLLEKKYYSIPIGYDLEYWKQFESSKIKKNDNKILIIHAPSHREIKGTKYVLNAIDRLVKEGYNIDFKLLENLTNPEVREWVNASDIVIDQLLGGWHGGFALEAMALAKPTLCFLDKMWINHPGYSYAKNIPIINTNPDNICDNLKLLIKNPDLRLEIGQKSRKYVEEVHDSKVVAQQLLELYQKL